MPELSPSPPGEKTRQPVPQPLVTFHAGSGVHNRILSLGRQGAARLVFVPGWATDFSAWRHLLAALAPHFEIACFESREKPGTRRSGAPGYSFEEMAEDLRLFLLAQGEPFVLMGASVGAAMCIRTAAGLPVQPQAMVLLTPVQRFRAPRFFGLLRLVPRAFIPVLLPMGKRVIRQTNYGSDQPLVEELLDSLDAEGIHVLRQSVRDLRRLRLSAAWLEAIECPSLVIGCPEEGLHLEVEAADVASHIRGCAYHSVRSTGELHSRKCGQLIANWLQPFQPLHS